MAYAPQSLEEYAQFLLVGADAALADFGREILQLIDDDVSEEYWTLCDELENLTEKKFPNNEPGKALAHLEDELSKFENSEDERKEAIGDALEWLEETRKALVSINPAQAPKLEYDL